MATNAELRALASEVLAHRLSHWGAGPAPKGRVLMHPTPEVQCEREWRAACTALKEER